MGKWRKLLFVGVPRDSSYFLIADAQSNPVDTHQLSSAIIVAMGYQHLFHERDLALLYDWLQETGELYVDLDRPHSGGDDNSAYFVSTLGQLKKIVAAESHRETSITIFRENSIRFAE